MRFADKVCQRTPPFSVVHKISAGMQGLAVPYGLSLYSDPKVVAFNGGGGIDFMCTVNNITVGIIVLHLCRKVELDAQLAIANANTGDGDIYAVRITARWK